MKNFLFSIFTVIIVSVIISCSSTPRSVAPSYILPIIRINTDNAAPILDREIWVPMTFSLTDHNNPSNNISKIDNQQIRGRGNSTWSYEDGAKNPYRIRFRENHPLFGLPAARNWVLLKSGGALNNSIGFELGQRLGLQYTCSFYHVELYLNDDYMGMYLFTEHRQADPSGLGAPGRPKVDLNEGWFIEIDRYWDEDPKFRTTNYDLPIMIKTPEFYPLDIDNPAYNFVIDNWSELTNLMSSSDFPENGYRDLIDIDTFVKYFIVQTIMMNKDLFRPGAEDGLEIGSVFFYKDKDGKISAGPLWDLDWSLSADAFEGREFSANSFPYLIHPFFNRFFQDPVFSARYKEIWNENFLIISEMPTFIDDLALKIRGGVIKDIDRWNSDRSFDWEIKELKNYYNARITYLNEIYNK